jgi:hypothetical protein
LFLSWELQCKVVRSAVSPLFYWHLEESSDVCNLLQQIHRHPDIPRPLSWIQDCEANKDR